MDDFRIGFFCEREFNAQLLEEWGSSLNILKNTKAMGFLASKCTAWRGVVLKKEDFTFLFSSLSIILSEILCAFVTIPEP